MVTEQARRAAALALEDPNVDPTSGALYFRALASLGRPPAWRGVTLSRVIGHHAFFWGHR